MTGSGLHSIRTKIIAAIGAVIGVMLLLSLFLLFTYIRILGSYERQMTGIIEEYRLSAETDRLVTLYSSCIQNPLDADYKTQFRQCSAGIDLLLKRLGQRSGNAQIALAYSGLQNSVQHMVDLCREGLAALAVRDMLKTESIYQEVSRKQPYISDNSARVIVQEVRQFADQQAQSRRMNNRRLMLLLFLLAAAVVTCVFYALSVAKKLTHPLSKLTSVVQRIAAGEMTVDVSAALLSRRDETGSLSQGFEHMLIHLRTTLQNLNDEVEIRKQAELRAKQASAAKSEFLANMSHEIRTPMNAIIGFADLLAAEIPDDRQRQRAAIIANSGQALLRLINDILDLSKIEAGKIDIKPEFSSPARLLEEVHQIFLRRAEENGVTLTFSIDLSLQADFLLDHARLRQILVNLIGNAIKFTEGGSVDVHGFCARPYEDPLLCDLTISVTDTGIGISDEFKSRLFGAFEQAAGQDHAKYGGTGLGLPISQRLARLMNGEILADDNPAGRGSVFTLLLRAIPITAKPPPLLPEGVDPLVFHEQPSILIVDPVDSNRELLKSFLEPYGFPVVEAIDGRQAFERVKIHRPGLVLTELVMPTADGFELARLLREADPASATESPFSSIPIIAVTASAMGNRTGFDEHNFDAILMKPVSRAELILAISRFISHSGSASAAAPSASTVAPVVLHTVLEESLVTQLASLRKSLRVNQATKLAQKLLIAGERCGEPELVRLGRELGDAAELFQVDKLKSILAELTELTTQPPIPPSAFSHSTEPGEPS